MWKTDCLPIDWDDDDDVKVKIVIIDEGSLMMLGNMDDLHDSMFLLWSIYIVLKFFADTDNVMFCDHN